MKMHAEKKIVQMKILNINFRTKNSISYGDFFSVSIFFLIYLPLEEKVCTIYFATFWFRL